ncbi:MAG: alpha-L-arabinofuranosidase C-terminal domain-containing protein [Planctomycetota bacterium]|jgi:alpha-N-arabinofuranosidase
MDFRTDTHSTVQVNCLFGGWGQATGKAWFDDLNLQLISADVESRRRPKMYYTDDSRGRAFAKDPDVARFGDRYLMYYTISRPGKGIAIGIAESENLNDWEKVGEILPEASYEKNGIGAPGALVRDGKLHLFYQTYGNREKDAICHAWSEDGINFTRNETNPIFRPTGDWNCGRAIDADVIEFKGSFLLYCATRDPSYKIQKLVVASAPVDSGFRRESWKQLGSGSILEPELYWEKRCIEASSVCEHDGKLYMFYAGGYNNEPQQIGCAVSSDGVEWQRLSQLPLLPNGRANEWNSNESGHPGVFVDDDGQMYLFFQGNNNKGKNWFLSNMIVKWDGEMPYLVRQRDDQVFRIRETIKPKIVIDPAKTKEPISQFIYGQFIEHLGRCIYGGIWAEMLEDRKFYFPVTADYRPYGGRGITEERPLPVVSASPWQIVGSAELVRMVEEDSFVGDHTPLIGSGAGIRQLDLGLVKNKQYRGYIWLKGDKQHADVEVAFVWGDGRTDRDSTAFRAVADRYIKYPFEFTSGADTSKGKLEIKVSTGSCYVGTVSLMPADNIQGMRADTMELLKELNAPLYRWPGGNFVSGYDWRDGIGDRDRRPPRVNPAWTGVEHNDFGFDEFMRFCGMLNAEPLVTVNTGFGDAYSAAEQLEYANGSADTYWGKKRAENGTAIPFGISFWCIGNEMFGSWQLGYMRLEHYVRKHNWVVDIMRKVDPDIIKIASGNAGPWSEGLLTNCSNHIDLIAEHFYCQERGDLAEHTAQIAEQIRRKVDFHRNLRDRLDTLEGKDIRIAMTEWNYWYGPHVFGELGTRYFLKDALGIARGLHEYFRHSDIVYMANYAQTVNVIGCIKASKTHAAMAATGQVLTLYRNHFGQIPVEAAGEFDQLDVSAALTADRRRVTVAIVNPTYQKYEVSVSLKGRGISSSSGSWRITGPDEGSFNEPGKPDLVKIERRNADVDMSKIQISPLSVSLFELNLQ